MFDGQEALSKEDKAAGAKARLTVAQAEAHIRKRLVVLRWQYAMAAVLMKLAGHEDPGNRLTLSQTEDPFVHQVHLRNAAAADPSRIQIGPCFRVVDQQGVPHSYEAPHEVSCCSCVLWRRQRRQRRLQMLPRSSRVRQGQPVARLRATATCQALLLPVLLR